MTIENVKHEKAIKNKKSAANLLHPKSILLNLLLA